MSVLTLTSMLSGENSLNSKVEQFYIKLKKNSLAVD